MVRMPTITEKISANEAKFLFSWVSYHVQVLFWCIRVFLFVFLFVHVIYIFIYEHRQWIYIAGNVYASSNPFLSPKSFKFTFFCTFYVGGWDRNSPDTGYLLVKKLWFENTTVDLIDWFISSRNNNKLWYVGMVLNHYCICLTIVHFKIHCFTM